MNGILGMTELLLGTELSDGQRRCAQAVYRSGEGLLEIINDILDFAKIESGRLELAPSDFSLRALVEDTLELLAPRAHEKGLELSLREGAGVPSLVRADLLRLRQVLTNLISNAVKFTERGEVTVDLNVRSREESGAAAAALSSVVLEFTVRDSGIGISPQVLPGLFSAFTQAHGGMSRRYGGTGLGLAISKQLVELMGGAIAVQSAPGVGSQFSFTVPAVVAGSEPVGADAAELPALRVLVVDDNQTNRTVLENMLAAWGMQVTLAADAASALALLRSTTDAGRFDLALVDWQMPGMDGLALAQTARAEGLQPAMRWMMLSSSGAPDESRLAQEAGFARLIHKPIRKAELRQAILGIVPTQAAAEPPRADFRACVLVVEDNAVNQEVSAQMLRRLGCQVQLASSAVDGLRALTEQPFDLVLMDIQMPGMDGVQALRTFRSAAVQRYDFATPRTVPVVALTANALQGDRERFLDQGFNDYLAKPFRQRELAALLGRWLRSDGAEGPVAEAAAQPLAPAAAPAGAAVDGAASVALDRAALAKLRELDPSGESKLLQRVLKAFDASLQRLMPQLADAVRCEDFATVGQVVHTLKSSSASIGALKLSALCADTETQVRQHGRVSDAAGRLDLLTKEASRVQATLRELDDAALRELS
jgi:CheY-like chemotaxis protein/two-component sensor histidine kinase